MAGDSVLAVFESAAGAVSAALAVQQKLHAAGPTLPKDRRLRFRVGVHLGDVIEKLDGSVYGDGVNIAARLQELAEPGGVTVSDAVRGAVEGKVAASFADRGEQRVKNIPLPVRVFRVRSADAVQAAQAAAPEQGARPLPDKPSIVVLPFANLSGNPEDEYFADGMTEDVITELSRFGRLFVIARNTSFTFRRRGVDVQAVARQLGVHFVLEGSVRRSADRVRISAQLIEGGSGAHVWAERYDDVLDDVFSMQERITRQVVASMVPHIEAEEMRQLERGQRRFTEADDISWRAWKKLIDSYFGGSAAPAVEAVKLAEQAIARDGRCWLAYYVVSASHSWQIFMGWVADRRHTLEAARRAADTAVLLAPGEGRSYSVRASVALFYGDYRQAVADRRRSLELNPNDATAAFFLSWTEAAVGNVDRAKEVAAHALRLSPKDIWIGVAYLALAMAAFIERRSEELRNWAELAIQNHPTAPIRRVLMIAYAAEADDAALLDTHREKLAAIAPDFVPSLFRGDLRPFARPEHMQLLLESLAKAGLGPATT